LIAKFFAKKINERGVKMIKYESVCNSDVFDEIKSGETIFLLNRATNDVRWVDNMSVASLVKVFKHDNKDNRYEFYKEVEINENLPV
jgi:hypothetical protein